MIEMQLENQNIEMLPLQQMGEGWIQAIVGAELEQLRQFCLPNVTGTLLLPRRSVTLGNLDDLLANYHDWFDDVTDIQVEDHRISQVGAKLGVFYRLRLHRLDGWRLIEQQLYFTIKDGLVEKVWLLCSGFQPFETGTQPVFTAAQPTREPDPRRDDLLEFHSGAEDAAATCALLTPAIRAKLNGMQTGQVLEVHVDDPTARGDIEAWSRLSGNTLLKVAVDQGSELRFFLKKK